MDKVYMKQVIVCTKMRRGKGVHGSPIRVVTEVFNPDGTLIADSDPCGNITPENLLDFLKYRYQDVSEDKHL